MPESLFLQAFKGTNKTVPVWFMRQAGRYLPEYRAIKAQYSLEEMFRTPELAAHITCLPVDILSVDAAILFADILTLPSAMGVDITFSNEGPQIKTPKDLTQLHDFDDLTHVSKTIQLVNQQLPQNIPLIGFAGGPFTVLTYLIEGGGSANFAKTFELIYSQPQNFHRLLDRLTKNTIVYLNLQKKAGIKVFQIFDTWTGILRTEDYRNWVLPHLQQIFKEVDLPSIYFCRNSSSLLSLINECGSNFISVDHTVDLANLTTQKGIQGNLFNGLLYADWEILKKEVQDVLIGARHYKKYIFNFSHGVFPDTDLEKLKKITDYVHQFKWKK